MTHFLEEFENNLEKEVSITTTWFIQSWKCMLCVPSFSYTVVYSPLENVWAPQTVKYSMRC